jgi:nicotinamide riboside kinase
MRIAFTGPESSGKTTFSKWLKTQLPDSVLHLEFARTYLEQRGITEVSEEQFREIVEGQSSIIAKPTHCSHEIFDTDLFVLKIWNEEVFKLKLAELEIRPSYKMDIHFLCAPDVEWESDPLRSAPDKLERIGLFEKYKTELIQSQSHFIILSGKMEEKKSLILSSIQSFLSKCN